MLNMSEYVQKYKQEEMRGVIVEDCRYMCDKEYVGAEK